MSTFYFFTDPGKLKNQNANQAFGPVDTTSANPLTDQYRITDLHSGLDAPAIAVCDGVICVQPDDQGTFSIVLKPHYQPPFDFPYIKYFIYKGVKKDSLVDLNAVVDDDSIPFTQRIKKAWVDDDPGAPNPISESAQVLGLAYVKGFEHPVNGSLTKIFTDSDPIDNFFYYSNPDFQLPVVKAGEKIGVFSNAEFGFEIVLERLGYEPKIELARTSANLIEVPSFTRANPEPDDADYFVHWHEKEACLNYIDPCAFYGGFCDFKVFYKTGAGTGNKIKLDKPQEIYEDLLIKFENRHKIYFDIRNDYNFSLNYFKDYGSEVRLTNPADGVESPLGTQPPLWPIIVTDLQAVLTLGEIKEQFFNTSLRLPTGQNNVPLVYLSKAYAKGFRRLKRKHKVQHPSKMIGGTLSPYTQAVNIAFPIVKDIGGNDVFYTGYYKVNYYDQDRDDNTANTLTPSREFYLNGLFRPLDMNQILALKEGNLHYILWHEELLINLTGQGGSVYIGSVGIAKDRGHTTLFAFPEYFVHGSGTGKPPRSFTTWTNKTVISDKMFIEKIFELFGNKKLTKKEHEVAAILDELEVIIIENQPFDFVTNVFRKTENPEDYIFILFENSEFETQEGVLDGQSFGVSNLPIYMKVDEVTNAIDDNGNQYLRTVIDAVAYQQVNNNEIKKISIELDKMVFEYANY